MALELLVITDSGNGLFIDGNKASPVDSPLLTKASDAELWCFLRSAPEQTDEQTIETPMIWDAFAPITTPL